MLSGSVGGELEDDILERCCLSDWPVNTSYLGSRWQTSHINFEVADLPPENIGASPAQATRGLVLVTIDHPPTLESRAGQNNRQTVGVADDVGVVVVNDRAGNQVGAWREVDNGRGGRGCAWAAVSRSATVAGGNSGIDGGCVIGNTIALGAEVLDTAENGVA